MEESVQEILVFSWNRGTGLQVSPLKFQSHHEKDGWHTVVSWACYIQHDDLEQQPTWEPSAKTTLPSSGGKEGLVFMRASEDPVLPSVDVSDPESSRGTRRRGRVERLLVGTKRETHLSDWVAEIWARCTDQQILAPDTEVLVGTDSRITRPFSGG